MKVLIVVLLVVLLLVFLYRRLRPYIKILRETVSTVRGFVGGLKASDAKSTRGGDRREHLVRCSTCGTWVPATRVLIDEGSEATFCSTACAQIQIPMKQRASKK